MRSWYSSDQWHTAGVTFGGKWQGTFGTIWQDPASANEAANSRDQYALAVPERRSPDDYEHEETPWHYVTVSPPALLGARDFFNSETGTAEAGKPRSWASTAWRDLGEFWGYCQPLGGAWKASFRLVTWVICSRSRGPGR